MGDLESFVADATVDEAVFALRPDYRACLVAVTGIAPGGDPHAADPVIETLLGSAESAARVALERVPVDRLPHIAAWREAFAAFGARPNRTRNSAEALVRRAPSGLPRINRLTDLYNAISVLHQVPVGGEDLDAYAGSPRLIRSSGREPFDTVADGEPVIDHPEPGEVIWCDDAGVTCRRWNWRQGRRTRLHEGSTSALFILDALDPMTDSELEEAVGNLIVHVARLGPDVQVARRTIRAAAPTSPPAAGRATSWPLPGQDG